VKNYATRTIERAQRVSERGSEERTDSESHGRHRVGRRRRTAAGAWIIIEDVRSDEWGIDGTPMTTEALKKMAAQAK
jgi:hypothetical protein